MQIKAKDEEDLEWIVMEGDSKYWCRPQNQTQRQSLQLFH